MLYVSPWIKLWNYRENSPQWYIRFDGPSPAFCCIHGEVTTFIYFHSASTPKRSPSFFESVSHEETSPPNIIYIFKKNRLSSIIILAAPPPFFGYLAGWKKALLLNYRNVNKYSICMFAYVRTWWIFSVHACSVMLLET